MGVISAPGTLNKATNGRTRPAVAWLVLATLVSGSQLAAQEQTAAQGQTAAVLKLHEVNFSYRSRVAYLSCSAIENRVASILRVLGARNDVQVTASGCNSVAMTMGEPDMGQMPADGWGTPSERWPSSSDPWRTSSDPLGNRSRKRDQLSQVRIRAMMPIAVTPEVLAEMERDKSRRELISRVTGNPAARLDDPIVFPAQRQPVALSPSTLDLRPEECELLEQMSQDVFRRLDIRVVRGSRNCDRNQISRIPPQVTVEALMPVLPRTPQVAPGTGSSEPDPGAPTDSGTQPPAPK